MNTVENLEENGKPRYIYYEEEFGGLLRVVEDGPPTEGAFLKIHRVHSTTRISIDVFDDLSDEEPRMTVIVKDPKLLGKDARPDFIEFLENYL